MAKKKDSAIEQGLRRVVREGHAKDEVITVKQVRSRVEAALGLDAGFLQEEAWKARSKKIITDAYAEQDEESGVEASPATTQNKRAEATDSGKKHKEREPKRSKAVSLTAVQSPVLNGGTNTKPVDEHSTPETSSGSEDEDRPNGNNREVAKAELKKPDHIPPPINGVKRKASEQSSSASRDESEDDDHALKAQKTSKSSSSSSDEGSDMQSDKPKTIAAHASSKSKAPAAASSHTLQEIPTRGFRPPSGFVLMKPAQLDQSTPLSDVGLEGQQIWHITAPSNVTLSSISSLTVDAIRSHASLLTHNGVEYTLNEDESFVNDSATVFIPTSEGYRPVPHKIDRKLNLQQKFTLPNLTSKQASQITGSQAAGDIAQAAVSNVRPQPKGLRMRYRPPGFGAGNPGAIGSGSESADEAYEGTSAPTFQFPSGLGVHGADGRVGGDLAVDVTMADGGSQLSTKKSKKKWKEKHESGIAGTAVNVIAKQASIQSSRDSLAERRPSDWEATRLKPSNLTLNGIPIEDSTKDPAEDEDQAGRREEKAQRKEEKRSKRERKEAKRKAKEAAEAS